MDKELVLMRLENGLTYREISEKTNIKQSTVMNKIKRYVCYMYRDFVRNDCDLNYVSVLYNISTDTSLKCLKEAEKFLHIGLCYSKVKKGKNT